jgi:ATP-binding cassette subfamily F protein 3
LHGQLAKVEASLADSGIYDATRKDQLREALAQQAKLKVRESELEEAWMAALETLETLQAELEALS